MSDEAVVRDVYYTGNPKRERAAVLLRLSPSWFRFGSLEILSRTGEIAVLKQLSDFIIKVTAQMIKVWTLLINYKWVINTTFNFQEYFPDIHLTDDNRFIRLFSEIAHRTLDLVAKWQGE